MLSTADTNGQSSGAASDTLAAPTATGGTQSAGGGRTVMPDTAEPEAMAPSMSAPEAGAASAEAHGRTAPDAHALLTAKYGPALVADMEDAQLLLSYLTRNGLQEDRKIPDATIQAIIAARVRMQQQSFDCEKDEAEFRKNYGVLARAAAPVSVVSLRDSLPLSRHHAGVPGTEADDDGDQAAVSSRWRQWFPWKDRSMFSIAEVTCFEYRNYAMLVLVLLLITQTYWTICSSLYSRLPPLDLDTATVAEARGEAAALPSPPPADLNVPQDLNATAKLSKEQLALRYIEAQSQNVTKSRLEALSFWVWPFLDQSTRTAIHGGQPAAGHTNTDTDIMVAANQVVSVMQAWWLPLLYGALGSMVYVVCTLSVLARDRLFRREALVTLNLRVYLGMISGLAIGWFLKEIGPTANTVASVSPFALAFVAGYGVELFFALLDKVVSSFTGAEGAKT